MASDWLGVGWEVVASDISRETCLRQVLFPRQAVTARPPCSSCPTASMIPADRRIRLDDPCLRGTETIPIPGAVMRPQVSPRDPFASFPS